jgi:hypothetical protein
VKFDIALNSPLQFRQDNGKDSFSFNFNGSGTLSIYSVTSGFNSTLQTGKQEDGIGTFGFAVVLNSSPSQQASPLSFTVHSTGGALTLANFEVVAGGNGNGHTDFAVNAANGSCTGNIGGGNGTADSTATHTGTVGTCTTATTPEPTSLAFFGTGLIGLGVIMRRKFAHS